MSFGAGGVVGQAGFLSVRHPLLQVGDLDAVERLERGRLARRCRRAQRQQRSCAGARSDRSCVGPNTLVELGSRGDDHPGAGKAHELDGMLRRQARVDRGVDANCLCGKQQRKQLRAVDRDDRDRVTPLHAHLGQHGRGSVHVASELRERPDERCVEALRVGQHRHGRAIGPQLSRPPHQLVGARRKAAIAQRNALDRGQLRRSAEGWPERAGIARSVCCGGTHRRVSARPVGEGM